MSNEKLKELEKEFNKKECFRIILIDNGFDTDEESIELHRKVYGSESKDSHPMRDYISQLDSGFKKDILNNINSSPRPDTRYDILIYCNIALDDTMFDILTYDNIQDLETYTKLEIYDELMSLFSELATYCYNNRGFFIVGIVEFIRNPKCLLLERDNKFGNHRMVVNKYDLGYED